MHLAPRIEVSSMAELVIRGGEVYDGSGRSPVRADVAIHQGRIAAIGCVAERGRDEIDARGLAVAPGFIDVHTHYDCQLFWDAQATPSPWHGVTTVVIGNCGFTVAPCPVEQRETVMRLLAFVEGMPLAALRAGLPWSWATFPEYLAALEARGLGINVAAFVGHSAIRVEVMGPDAVERSATPEECGRMAELVREALRAGAIGWSTSLSPTHFFADDGKPAPSRLAEHEELLALATAVRGVGRRAVIEIAPRATIGSVDDRAAEQQELASLARASGALVTWAPLFQSPYQPGAALRVLDEAAALQRSGAMVVPQVGCRPLELRFDFATTGFGLENNPFWRPIMALPRAERRARFAEPGFRAELRAMSHGFVAALAPGWDRLVLRLPAQDATARWRDRSVRDIAATLGKDPLDSFCDLVLEDDLEGQWGALLFNVDEAEMAAMVRHPAGMLALSDAGAHGDTLCDQGFTTSLLGHWVRERGDFALEEAIRLITSVPAERFGLVDRGRLAPGYAADVVVFDPARIATAPTERVSDLPGGERRLLQRAEGVVDVLVNGEAVVRAGQPRQTMPGRVLRGR